MARRLVGLLVVVLVGLLIAVGLLAAKVTSLDHRLDSVELTGKYGTFLDPCNAYLHALDRYLHGFTMLVPTLPSGC